MIANWVPAELTPARPEDVSRAYRTALTNMLGAPTDLAVAVLHAHGALETGHFKSCWNHNAGNIKAGQMYEGLYCCIKLNEVLGGRTIWFDPRGQLDGRDGPIKGPVYDIPPGHPQTRMRAYLSLAGGVEDKIRFLLKDRWRDALEMAWDGDPAAYVDAIRERGYFTAALEPYRRAVVSLTQKYLPIAEATGKLIVTPKLEPDSEELCGDIAVCNRFDVQWKGWFLPDPNIEAVHEQRDADIRGDDFRERDTEPGEA
jgi:hypothetical protein